MFKLEVDVVFTFGALFSAIFTVIVSLPLFPYWSFQDIVDVTVSPLVFPLPLMFQPADIFPVDELIEISALVFFLSPYS